MALYIDIFVSRVLVPGFFRNYWSYLLHNHGYIQRSDKIGKHLLGYLSYILMASSVGYNSIFPLCMCSICKSLDVFPFFEICIKSPT